MNNLRTILLVGLILTVTFLAFLPCLENSFVNWDDYAYITEVVSLQRLSFESTKQIFTSFFLGLYQPLNRFSYLVEYNFFKLDTFAYHLTNIILHLFVCLSLFWLIYLLTRSKSVSLITTVLFAVHPLRVESVAWVSGRQDIFCALFFLLAIVSYCYYLRKGKISKYYYFSLILFIFSLLSKAMAITLPVVLFLIDYLFYRKPDKRIFLDKIPFFFLSFIFCIVAILGKYSSGFMRNDNLVVFPSMFSIVFHNIVFYINKILLPVKLSCTYPYSIIKDIHFLYSLAIVTVLFIVVVMSGRYTRKVIFGSAFFLATILPVLQFVTVGSTIAADRYTYIPSIGLFYLAGCGFVWLYKRGTRNTAWIKPSLLFLLIIIVGTFSYLTWQRCKVWKESITLWNDVLKKYPDVSVAYNNRGDVYNDKGNLDQAVSDYTKAIELNPVLAEAYNNRGSAYAKKGNFDQAISDFNKAIQLNHDFTQAYYNRGVAYSEKGNFDQALSDYNKVIQLDPNFTHAYNNRGSIYNVKSNYDRAISDFNKTIELDPNAALAYCNRGIAYTKKNNYDQAIADYNKAIELNPKYADAYNKRAVAYYFKQEYAKAWDDTQKAEILGYKPNKADLEFVNKLKEALEKEK